MPWVRFTRDFDYKPKPRVFQVYPKGYVGLVTTACAKEAIGENAAVKIKKPETADASNRS